MTVAPLRGDDVPPEGTSAAPGGRDTAPGSARASNGEIVPGGQGAVDAAEPPRPSSRRAAEPTGLTKIKDTGDGGAGKPGSNEQR